MDEFDKVEKLKQRANVSYEAARDALRACDGDLLDAMVYLEKQGKVAPPEQATFSTDAADKTSYENVPKVVEDHRQTEDPSFGDQLGTVLKVAFRKSIENYLVVSHRGKEVFRLPILIFILILLFGNILLLLAMGIALFFDVRYSFDGKDNMSAINSMMDKAGNKAAEWMDEAKAEAAKEEREKKKEREREADSKSDDEKK